MIGRKIGKLIRRLERPYDVYNRIEVSRSALLDNVDIFAKLSGLAIIPVLKGNAYGHGIEQVAMALKARQFPFIAVDGYFEALKVLDHNDRQPVLVMGMIQPQNFARIRTRGLVFVVQDTATIRALGKLKKRITIHLEINTGMNRYGVKPTEIDEYLELIQHYPHLKLDGIMSHLADADGDNIATVKEATEQFDKTVEIILNAGFTPTWFHIAQSAGGVRTESLHANAMRLGLGLYGINPFSYEHTVHDVLSDLRPVMRLVSTISRVQELQAGDKVSYNYTFTAPKAMRIGILPLGYHEGIPRSLSNKGAVVIGNQHVPIVGRVCMNHTMIDLSQAKEGVGDEVVVYSDDPRDVNSISGIAATHDEFVYALLTGLSPDVRRYLVS